MHIKSLLVKELRDRCHRSPDEKKKLTDEDLDLVTGGVGQETDDETTDEPMGLCPTQASFEKWVKY